MNLENQQPPPWETAANALSYEPIKARRFTRAEIQTIIKSACESYSDGLQAKIDQNQKSVQWADEMRLALAKELGCIGSASHVVESVQKLCAENAALLAQVKRLRDLLNETRPLGGDDMPLVWFLERDKALADTQQEAK